MGIPDLALMHQAAQAGRGGAGQLTNKSPEQALWELALGGAAVTLAATDVGLGAKQMGQLSRTAQELSQGGVTLSQGQWSDGLKAAQQGDGAVQRFVAGLKDASATAKEKLRRVLASVHNGGKEQPELAGVPKGAVDEADEAKQLGQPLRSTTGTAATGTKAGAKLTEELTNQQVEAIVAKYPQWENTKYFVGRRLDPNNLPPGYSYRVKNGKPELYRSSKDGPFPPLTVENGIVMLQTGKSNRLSVFSRYRKNYLDWIEQGQGEAARIAAEKRIKDGNQLHHLVPDAVVRDNEITRELMSRSKTYTLDRGPNILDMPQVHSPKTGEIVHLGSHPKFNKYVETLLNQKATQLTRGRTIPLDQVNVKDLDNALRQVEDKLREQIINRTLPKDILKDLEGGGFSISEGIKDPQGGEFA